MRKTFITLFILIFILGLVPFNFSSAAGLATRLKGRILLQVESNGEAWYVNPDNEKRYYLDRPADAFQIMRDLGLGISSRDFDSFNGIAANRLSGKILLKVEDSGKAYYVNPVDLKMHYLGRPADAFQIMRNLGLGIRNNDIEQIGIYSKNASLSIKINNSSCEQYNHFANFNIFKNENIVASVSVSSCESNQGEFIKADDKHGYFSILPGGLGGYILYGKYSNLYRINLNSNLVENIFDNTLTDLDFSSDLNKIIFRKDNKLILKNISDFSELEYDLPTEAKNAQFGSFKFSPDGKNVGVAVGYGPDNEKGEIYSLNLNSTVYSLREEIEYAAIQITGWDSRGNMLWKKR